MERHWTVDLLWIALALGLVALNGFFVAAEFALVKVRPARVAQLVRQRKPFARSAQWLSRRLDRSLSACQLGITMASLALGWIGEPAVAHLLAPAFRATGISAPSVVHGISFAISFTLITAAHLVLGEQTPKIFAIRRPELLAIWCAIPLRTFYVVSFPLLRGLDAATGVILRSMGVPRGAGHESPHSQEELRSLMSHARAHGEVSSWEHRLVEAAFDFDDMVCRQVMVPRSEVELLDLRAPLDESLGVIRRSKHTRYPVCEGSLDKVLGILHVKDLVGLSAEGSPDLRSRMRPPRYVPETVSISRLLSHFKATRQHMALVVDEFGIIVGIVTLENVLEQIVGPVRDEFDVESPEIVPEGEGRYLVLGGAPISKLAELLGRPVEAEGVDTVAGLVALRLGRVPDTGDRLPLERTVLEVLEVRQNHATRLRLFTGPDAASDAATQKAEPASDTAEDFPED